MCHKSFRHATFVELHHVISVISVIYLLYLLYHLLLWLPVKKKVFKKRDIGWGPQPCDVLAVHGGLRCQQQLGALHVALAMLPDAAESRPQHRRSGTRGSVTGGDRWAPHGWGPGGPRRRPSPRGTPRPPGGRCRLPSAALLPRHRRVGPGCRGRGAGGPGRPGGRRWAPRGRCRRLGARRDEKQKWRCCFFSFFFSFDLSDYICLL